MGNLNYLRALGLISGRVGDTIYRIRNGKTHMYARPTTHKISQSPKSVEVRRRFSVIQKLTTALKKVFILNAIWAQYTRDLCKKTARHKTLNGNIFTANYPVSAPGVDISLTRLIPEGGNFNAEIHLILLDRNILKIILKALTDIGIINESVNMEVSAQGIMKLTGPSTEDYGSTSFIPLAAQSIRFQKETPLEFVFTLMDEEYDLLQNYAERKFVVNLLVKNVYGYTNFFSRNLTGEV